MICERMLREQEAALRAEYEAALCGKLAEQYESFVRFSQDQVQRRHLQPQDISCKFPLDCVMNHFYRVLSAIISFHVSFQIYRND